ncbi:hypothetical protein THIOKS13000005 [Thiocapsa sp. KS1]|nr:glycosyltransferase [Thiocapsa sp. KS1]CRI66650.1 hypothetical protein THIOKS13000005 [Thiocapsa sp. KS1]
MRIVILAPEIEPPLSEGRKRFVIDLTNALTAEGHTTLLLTSGDRTAQLPIVAPRRIVPCRHKLTRLFGPLFALPSVCGHHEAEVVLNFPYGTFSGRHFLPARAYMMVADRLCSYRGIPCLTVLYSIDRHSAPEDLSRWVRRLVTGSVTGWSGPTVPLGRDIAAWPQANRSQPTGRRVLFAAGMWQPTRDRFEHVMNVRGLVDLLRAGDQLAASGVQLHVAVPLLSDAGCRRWLLEHPLNRWPTGTLTLAGFSEVPQVYLDADVFAFPYAEEITQFIPTSVIESMLAGTPVVLSSHRFLAPLIDAKVVTPFLSGESNSLATAITSLLDDPVHWLEQSMRAQEFARNRFDIHASVKRLIEYATAAVAS